MPARAGMAELVDALGLGSSGFICAGSSPVPGTFLHHILTMDELKQKLMDLGLSAEMVDQVIQTVGDFVQAKVPGVDRAMVEKLLAGETSDLLGMATRFLGSKFM
jgi:hypothetical protein